VANALTGSSTQSGRPPANCPRATRAGAPGACRGTLGPPASRTSRRCHYRPTRAPGTDTRAYQLWLSPSRSPGPGTRPRSRRSDQAEHGLADPVLDAVGRGNCQGELHSRERRNGRVVGALQRSSRPRLGKTRRPDGARGPDLRESQFSYEHAMAGENANPREQRSALALCDRRGCEY
jgi:hypothetical protein